jgi:hypothetical protein
MNPELKVKWVEALRSGKYTQGHTTFKSSEGYCCLGVLCVVAGHPEFIAPDNYRELRKVAGLKDNDTNHLWKMNDVELKTFPEIADYIEATL